jgi:hypothetical protein
MRTRSCRGASVTNCCRWLSLVVGVLALLGIVAPGTAGAQAQFAASGSWQSNNGQDKKGTWQVTGTGTNADLSGTFTATGPSDVTQGSVFGTTGGDAGEIKFGILYQDAEEATFTGTIAGGSMSGTYTTKAGDAGTWSGTVGPPQ